MTKIKFIVKPKNQCAFCCSKYCLGCNKNDTEAFVEWFDKNVQNLSCEDEEADVAMMKEWCKNNNHEWRDDGVYNMNVNDAFTSNMKTIDWVSRNAKYIDFSVDRSNDTETEPESDTDSEDYEEYECEECYKNVRTTKDLSKSYGCYTMRFCEDCYVDMEEVCKDCKNPIDADDSEDICLCSEP